MSLDKDVMDVCFDVTVDRKDDDPLYALIKGWCSQVVLSLMMSAAKQQVRQSSLCIVGYHLCDALKRE